jgi:hypothetical protein
MSQIDPIGLARTWMPAAMSLAGIASLDCLFVTDLLPSQPAENTPPGQKT